MNRWLASVIAIAGGAVAGGAVMLGIGTAIGALMYIFVFGDDTWPGWVDPAFAIGMPLLWLVFGGWVAWIIWLKLGAARAAG